MKLLGSKTFQFLIFSLFLFVTSWSQAGVRSVGNGGGFAELQFVYYFENSKHLVQFCLEDPGNKCRLNSQDKILWTNLLEKMQHLRAGYSIDFSANQAAKWEIQNDKIVIDSKSLYTAQDVEIPEYRILAFAISVQLSLIQDSKNDFEKTLQSTEQAFQDIQFQNKKTGIAIQGQNIYFHQLKIKLPKEELTFFALEDDRSSYSLNETILLKYPNLDLNSLSFSQLSSGVMGTTGIFFGYIQGHYRNEVRFQGKKMRLQFHLNAQGAIFTNSIQLDFALK